jgi:hypothetical protein
VPPCLHLGWNVRRFHGPFNQVNENEIGSYDPGVNLSGLGAAGMKAGIHTWSPNEGHCNWKRLLPVSDSRVVRDLTHYVG